MTQKLLLGLLMISKKISALAQHFLTAKKKIAIICKMSKKRNFWHLEGNTMLLTPVNHLCFRAHMFLVACYATLYPALSVGRSVGRSVGWSVGRSVGPHFTFSAFLSVLSSLLLPKCSSDLLHHCPCPPARD